MTPRTAPASGSGPPDGQAVAPPLLSAKDRQALDLLVSSEHPVVGSFPHGALIVFDHDLRFLSAGGLGLQEVGLSREALEGRTIHEAFPPETAAVLEPPYRTALSGECTTVDVPYGGRTFSLRLSPLLGEHGVVLAGMGFAQDVTQTRLSQEKLRQSEQRFRLAFEHAPIGMAIVGMDGLFRDVNPALCQLTGYPSDDLRALTFQDITHPDDLDTDLGLLARLLSGELTSYAMDKRYRTASGEIVWATLTVSLVLADDGTPLHFLSQIQDITNRKLSEQATERVFRSAFEDALVGMCLTGLDGRLLVVNPVFEALLDRSSADLVGRGFVDFTHPEDVEHSARGLQQMLDGVASGFVTTQRYLRPDGSVVHAEQSTSLVRSDDGTPQYFSTQTVDVTARWVAEREAQTRVLMLSGVIANSQSLVYVKDLDGRYLLANEPFERAFGVAESDLLGKDDTYLDPELAPVWRVNDLRAQQGEYHVKEWSDGPDGRMFYESVKFPLRDPDGTVYATCGISLDVTESRQAAEAMARARDAALASTQAKTDFLATMSHEIRTPMNAVIGLTGLLLESDLDARQRGFLETIRSSGDALLAVINNILDFSRLEARGTVLESAPFRLRACVDEAVAIVAPAAGDLELVSHVDAQCPDVLVGDSHRLRQVLVNLLANALKFTESGEVVLTVAPSADQDAGGDEATPSASPAVAPDRVALSFCVRDTGIGISEAGVAGLFAPFSQVDTSITRLYGGSGLGLAISRSLVEAMGGTVSVTTTPGVGSTFRVDVVLPTGADGAVPLALPAAAALPGVRVLVVDDNDTSRKTLRVQLEQAGAVVVTADSIASALELLAGSRFDVAIVDKQMPDGDGEQLATRLRSLPASSAMPLVLLTSLAAPAPQSDLFDVHHSKPVRFGDLLASVAGLVHRGQPDARPPAGQAWPTAGVAAAPPLRVLLVEDNAVNQSVGVAMLTRLGHRVDVAGNGREAVLQVAGCRYDVVLMDVHMPVMDGLQATARIRDELPPERQPHVIALTASSLDSDRRACVAAGMDGFLLKPVRLDELARALAGAPARAAVPAPAPGGESDQQSTYDGVHARLDAVLGPDRDDPARQELVDALLEQTPVYLAALADDLGREDGGSAAVGAHTLAGLAANLGATVLARSAREGELMARAGDLAGARSVLARMRHEQELLARALT